MVTWQDMPATSRIEYTRRNPTGKLVKSVSVTKYTRAQREVMATEQNTVEAEGAVEEVAIQEAKGREALVQERIRKTAEDSLKADGTIT